MNWQIGTLKVGRPMTHTDHTARFDDPLDMLNARWEQRRMIGQYWQIPDVRDDAAFWIVSIAHLRGERVGNA